MGMFDEFNKKIDKETVRKQIAEAQNAKSYKEVSEGIYKVEIEKLSIEKTKKAPIRPMFSMMLRITEGEYKKQCIFVNRVIAGTKNDMGMIGSVESLLNSFLGDDPIEFNGNYDDFAEEIMDIAEDVVKQVVLDIDYDPTAFNTVYVRNSWYK